MIRFVAVLSLFASRALSEDPCPRSNLNNFYRELQCEPVFENASKCPSSYNCDKFEARDRSKCNYRGEYYEIGESLPANKSDPCFAGCVCVKEGDKAVFACAVVECPEIWLPSPPENCKRLYSADSCCSTGMYCENETTKSKPATCDVDNATYVEGERFYPDSAPCKRCICKEGFAGELIEPFCEDLPCNVELGRFNRLHDNCVPVYYGEGGCCPISWKCPPVVETRIKSSRGNDTSTTAAKCKFGNLELKQFDVMEEDGLECKCLIPPYLTCFGA